MEPWGSTQIQAYPFGVDITRSFFALANDEPFNLPSQAPAIYLYSSEPSLSDALTGANAARSPVTYWTESQTSPYPRGYTIPAIPDPDQNSSAEARGYWLVVQYIAQAAGQTQIRREQIVLHRPQSVDSVPGTTASDLIALYPEIQTYVASQAVLTQYVSIALDLMKDDLQAMGMEYHKIFQLKRLKYALAYRAIAEHSLSQIREPDDKHAARYTEYTKKYKQQLENKKLWYSEGNSGAPEQTVTPAKSYGKVLA